MPEDVVFGTGPLGLAVARRLALASKPVRLVYGDNLYMHGPVDGPIREDLPYRPIGPNACARAEVATMLMNAHAGKVRATIGRASHFCGPTPIEVWHVPSAETITTRRSIEMVFEQIQLPARVQAPPKLAITILALFIPAIRAVKETLYQSERPWVVDHSKYARMFGDRTTPNEQAIAETLSCFGSSRHNGSVQWARLTAGHGREGA